MAKAKKVGNDISYISAADLTTKQYFIVKIDSAGKVALAGDGEAAIGTLQNKPNTGEEALVQIVGQALVVGSASLTVGAVIASDANGKAAAIGASEYGIGVVTEDPGADTQIGSVLLKSFGETT